MTTSDTKVGPSVFGWREWVAFPDLGVAKVKAKVDTGARTSSLHAEDIEIRKRGSQKWVYFTVYPLQRSRKGAVSGKAKLIDERPIKSSNGKSEIRPVILTTIKVGDKEWEIELTLTRRDLMGFRMLLGRQAVRGNALVDPGGSYLSSKKRKRFKRTTRS